MLVCTFCIKCASAKTDSNLKQITISRKYQASIDKTVGAMPPKLNPQTATATQIKTRLKWINVLLKKCIYVTDYGSFAVTEILVFRALYGRSDLWW